MKYLPYRAIVIFFPISCSKIYGIKKTQSGIGRYVLLVSPVSRQDLKKLIFSLLLDIINTCATEKNWITESEHFKDMKTTFLSYTPVYI